VLALTLATAWGPPAHAAQTSGSDSTVRRYEIFGGYLSLTDTNRFLTETSFPRGAGQLPFGNHLPLGWAAAVSLNLEDWLGLVGEASGSYKSVDVQDPRLGSGSGRANVHAAVGGPRLSLRVDRFTFFADAFVGIVRGAVSSDLEFESIAVGGARTRFALQTGGGFDVALTPTLGLRSTAEVRTFAGADQFRVATGLVYRFGPPAQVTVAAAEAPSRTAPPPTPAWEPPSPFGLTSAPAGRSEPSPPQEPPPPPPVVAAPAPPPSPPPEPQLAEPPPRLESAPAEARALLGKGDLDEAADLFLDYARRRAAETFTIAIGLFCERENVVRIVDDVGEPSDLLILPVSYRGRSCYRLVWGEYSTFGDAQEALSTIPLELRAPNQLPVAFSRVVPQQ
jgi:hypothetical protein